MTTTDRQDQPTATEFDVAELYERRTSLYDGWREQLVERVAPRSGDTVLDISCGSGQNCRPSTIASGRRDGSSG